MKILVTGGAGFIGSNFVHYWASKHPKHAITVLDKLTYAGNRANLEPIKDKVRFVKGDICDPTICKKLVENSDLIVHFAAESHVTRSEGAPELFEQTNVQGTKNLLELAASSNQLKKFIHISTDEVYGEAEGEHFFTEAEKQPGDSQATSAYAKSKARADDLAQAYLNKLPLNIVRPTNNFGPYQYPEKMLPRSITRVLTGKPILVWGKGNQVRDWLFAPDTAAAIDLVIQKAPDGEVYNIGANNKPEITNKDLAQWLMEYLKKYGAKLKYQPDPRPQHDFRYGVDTNKISQLGWQPNQDAWQRFAETVDWYLANKRWWKPLIKEAESIYKQ